MKIEKAWHRYLPLRRGRQWIYFHTGNSRQDGWWLLGYWAWMPKLRFVLWAIAFRITTGENNFFYTPQRREALGLLDKEIFE